jgi:sRNA-binding protein
MCRRVRRVCVVHAPAVAVVAVLASQGLAGCGPITYVGDVTHRASDAVDQARAAQAEKYAPYWWTRATQYLHKAREVAAHADFQGANRFGRLAAEAATHAAEDARIAAKDPAKRPPDTAPDIAPVKDAPIAPSRDLPAPARAAPARDPLAPAKDPAPRAAPARGARPPRIAPAKDPP